MVSQILNFGLPAQIDVQVAGLQVGQNRALAEQLMQQISRVPGTTDLRIQQPFDQPKWTVNVDRTRAQEVGFSQRDVAAGPAYQPQRQLSNLARPSISTRRTMLATTSPCRPRNTRSRSLQDLQNFPIAANGSSQQPQILGNLVSMTRGVEPGSLSHYNAQPVIDIYGSVEGADLASVAAGSRNPER